MKSAEHYNSVVFSREDLEAIKCSELNSEKRAKACRYGAEQVGDEVSIVCVSWNIGDGQTTRKQTVFKEVLAAYPRSLLLFQECTWKPHNATMNRSQSGCRRVDPKFSGYTELSSQNYRAVYSKDSCNRYLSIISDSTIFSDFQVPTEVFDLRDRLISLSGNRSNICINFLRENSSKRFFFAVNVHARRGDKTFVTEAISFISQLFGLVDCRGLPFVSGVVYAGDFNEDLTMREDKQLPRNFVLLATEDDQARTNRPVDFIGFVDGSFNTWANLRLSFGTLKNWVYDADELFSATNKETVQEVFHKQKKRASKRVSRNGEKHEVLNHPTIVAFMDFQNDLKEAINYAAEQNERLIH